VSPYRGRGIWQGTQSAEWITPEASTLLGVSGLSNACHVDTAFHVKK
jgi:hypothetical protein